MTAWVNGVRAVNLDWTHDKPETWEARARCLGTDPEAFYPEKGKPTTGARGICAKCPVATECLEAALERNDQWGVFGGKSLRQRNQIRKQRREGAA